MLSFLLLYPPEYQWDSLSQVVLHDSFFGLVGGRHITSRAKSVNRDMHRVPSTYNRSNLASQAGRYESLLYVVLHQGPPEGLHQRFPGMCMLQACRHLLRSGRHARSNVHSRGANITSARCLKRFFHMLRQKLTLSRRLWTPNRLLGHTMS